MVLAHCRSLEEIVILWFFNITDAFSFATHRKIIQIDTFSAILAMCWVIWRMTIYHVTPRATCCALDASGACDCRFFCDVWWFLNPSFPPPRVFLLMTSADWMQDPCCSISSFICSFWRTISISLSSVNLYSNCKFCEQRLSKNHITSLCLMLSDLLSKLQVS